MICFLIRRTKTRLDHCSAEQDQQLFRQVDLPELAQKVCPLEKVEPRNLKVPTAVLLSVMTGGGWGALTPPEDQLFRHITTPDEAKWCRLQTSGVTRLSHVLISLTGGQTVGGPAGTL